LRRRFTGIIKPAYRGDLHVSLVEPVTVAKRPIEQVEGLLTPDAMSVIVDSDWKGNVRELANAMEYALGRFARRSQ